MTRLALALVFVALLATPATAQLISYAAPPRVLAIDGTAAAPSISFINSTGAGLFTRLGAPVIVEAGAERMGFNSAAASVLSNMALAWTNSTTNSIDTKDTGLCRSSAGLVVVNDGSSTCSNTRDLGLRSLLVGSNLTLSSAAPTISSGFGTSPSVLAGGTATAFRVDVGTGGTATSGVIAMNATAVNGWNCSIADQTTANVNTRQSASSTTTVTFSTSVAWTASDILIVICAAF